MKNQSTEVMVTHIRAILEQNQNPEDLVSRDDVRTLSIEALIANFLEEAVSMAVVNADESLFQNISQATYVKDYTKYTGNVYDIADRYVIRNLSGGGGLQYDKIEPNGEEYYIKYGKVYLNGDSNTTAYNIFADKSDNTASSGYIFALNENYHKLTSENTINVSESLQRLLQIESDSWNGVVKDLLDKSSSIYRMCQNKYLNAVGVKDRPVAFKDFGTGNRKISVYPNASNHISINYIPKSVIGTESKWDDTAGKNVDVPVIPCDDLIYEGACFYCAYLVAMVQGWNTSETYRKEAVEALKAVNAESVRAAVRSMANDQ